MRKSIVSLATIVAMAASSLAASPARAKDHEKNREVEISRIEIPADVDIDHATPIAYLIIDANGKQVTNAVFRVEVVDGKRYSVAFRPGVAIDGATPLAVSCEGWNSPIPTYSWSNHTVHYGMTAVCTGETVEVRARGSLWSGPDYDMTNTLQDSLPGGGEWAYGINTVSIPRIRNCVDWSDFDWWELRMYFEVLRPWGWTQFWPYPLVRKSEIQCLDIV